MGKNLILISLVICAFVIAGCAIQENNIPTGKEPGSKLAIQGAMQIAQNSICITQGTLTNKFLYNNNSRTWWIDLEADRPGCNPACVVSEETMTAEINWRCTGLIEPTTTTLQPMSLEEAIAIASTSQCVAEGSLMQERAFYNEITRTWWIDIAANKTGCSPACVITDAAKTAEINWRCTGLIEP